MKQPFLIPFETKGDAQSGYLSVVENGGAVPFTVCRFYWLYDVPDFGERGNQAHLTNEQVLIPMHGAIRVSLETPRRRKFEFELHRPDQGLFVPALHWRKLHFYDQAVVLALASQPYDTADYVKDYAVFRTLREEPHG